MTMTQPVGTSGLAINVVRIENTSDKDFRRRYGPREWFTVPAHGSVFVTEEVAWHYLGRWWMDNLDPDPRRKKRAQEYWRLRVLYGAYEDDLVWEQQKPPLKVFTYDNQPINTIVDDPEGVAGAGPATELSRSLSLEQQVQMLSQQLLQLQAQADKDRERQASLDGPPAPVDGPNGPPIPMPQMQVPGMPGLRTAPPQVAPPGFEVNASAEPELDDLGNPLPPRLPVQAEVHPMAAALITDGVAAAAGENIEDAPAVAPAAGDGEPPEDGPTQAPKAGGVRVGGSKTTTGGKPR